MCSNLHLKRQLDKSLTLHWLQIIYAFFQQIDLILKHVVLVAINLASHSFVEHWAKLKKFAFIAYIEEK